MSDSTESEVRGPIFDKFENESEETGEPSYADISTTPNTELSPPDSPTSKNAALSKVVIDGRSKSSTLAASLSLEEQVRHIHFLFVFLDSYVNNGA